MTLSIWIRQLLSRATRKSRTIRRPATVPLRLELLEDRVVPANDITIVTGGSLTIPVAATTFGDTSNVTIDPSAFTGAGNVTLQANNDLSIVNALPPLASGQNLTFQAGGNISIGGDILGSGAIFSFTANDPAADQTQRTAGDAALTVQTGINVTDPGGAVAFVGGTGDTTGADLHPTCPIVLNSGAIVTADGINMVGAGNITTSTGINIDGATLNGGTSNISLTGTGADGAVQDFGVLVQNGAKVQTSGTGTVTITGTGGATGATPSIGVDIAGATTEREYGGWCSDDYRHGYGYGGRRGWHCDRVQCGSAGHRHWHDPVDRHGTGGLRQRGGSHHH